MIFEKSDEGFVGTVVQLPAGVLDFLLRLQLASFGTRELFSLAKSSLLPRLRLPIHLQKMRFSGVKVKTVELCSTPRNL